jgi:hypothetical protein
MAMTHTYAVLQISDSAYAEIKNALIKAGYSDHLHEDNEKIVIDMHGIALANHQWSPFTSEELRH